MGAVNQVQADEIFMADVSEHPMRRKGAFELLQFFQGGQEIIDRRFGHIGGGDDVVRRFNAGGDSTGYQDRFKLHLLHDSGCDRLVGAWAHGGAEGLGEVPAGLVERPVSGLGIAFAEMANVGGDGIGVGEF